jgi:hypothetical protein
MTTLVPQVPASALDGAADLAAVIKTLADRKVTAAPEKPSAAPKVVPVKAEAKAAISRLNDELASTELPSERRALSLLEQKELLALGSDAKAAEKALKVAVAAVKTSVFNHFDVGLEADNYADELPVDEKTGHYLVENELEVSGTGKKFVRQLSQGSPTVTGDALRKLYDEGKISRRQYYQATYRPEVRPVNEEGLLDLLKSKPELLDVLAEVITPGTVTASFWIRDVKDDDA